MGIALLARRFCFLWASHETSCQCNEMNIFKQCTIASRAALSKAHTSLYGTPYFSVRKTLIGRLIVFTATNQAEAGRRAAQRAGVARRLRPLQVPTARGSGPAVRRLPPAHLGVVTRSPALKRRSAGAMLQPVPALCRLCLRPEHRGIPTQKVEAGCCCPPTR